MKSMLFFYVYCCRNLFQKIQSWGGAVLRDVRYLSLANFANSVRKKENYIVKLYIYYIVYLVVLYQKQDQQILSQFEVACSMFIYTFTEKQVTAEKSWRKSRRGRYDNISFSNIKCHYFHSGILVQNVLFLRSPSDLAYIYVKYVNGQTKVLPVQDLKKNRWNLESLIRKQKLRNNLTTF